jgi:ADP-ribose pyrophosphatase YjhB (NUDIX family)
LSKDSGDYRKLPEKHLSILLIKRGRHPYKDEWALPGGFVRPNETVEQAAYRELLEESGVRNVNLSQLEVFSEPGRDPRGWIISCAFMALASAEQFTLQPDTDAEGLELVRREPTGTQKKYAGHERHQYHHLALRAFSHM